MAAVTKPQVIAIHEAAHAVVACELGAEVLWVESNEDGSGFCKINPDRDVSTRFDQAVIYAAGALAEWLKFGSAAPPSPSDLQGVNRLVPDARVKAIDRAEQILRNRWAEVEALASRLLEDPDGFVPLPFAPDHVNQ